MKIKKNKNNSKIIIKRINNKKQINKKIIKLKIIK